MRFQRDVEEWPYLDLKFTCKINYLKQNTFGMGWFLKILHVSDSFNAGVKIGIERVAEYESSDSHYLLWSAHTDSPRPLSSELSSYFSETFEWRGNLIGKYLMLAFLIRKIKPDILHLHSSIAGGLGRLQITNNKIFYSPHCYAFQRKDISNFVRLGLLTIERLLKFRTDRFFLNWPIEIELTKTKLKSSNLLFYPIIDIQRIRLALYRANIKHQVFLSVGRIRPQKDPKFLVACVKHSQEKSIFEWVGSGDDKLKKELENVGIGVVTWKNHSQIWGEPFTPIAVLITSAWESGPLTLFESIQNGVPVISRSFDAVQYYGFQSFNTPSSFGREIDNFLIDPEIRKIRFLEQQRNILNTFDRYVLSYGKSSPYR